MKTRHRIVLTLSATLTALSLLLLSVLVVQFLQLRRAAYTIVADARVLVTDLADDTFSYTVSVDQSIPISTSIPFSQAVTVPFNAVMPVNTTIVIPIDLGFATYDLPVPIRTVFPVDMEVTVPFSETMDVVTLVAVDLDVPIEIVIADTPLADYLQELTVTLEQTERQLHHPFSRND